MKTTETLDLQKIGKVIHTAKKVAKQYYQLTGRPLGITGEVAEYEAARLLGLCLAAVRQPGYDAIREDGSSDCRVQIKGRRVLSNFKPGQRLGRIDLSKEWDVVVLVLLNEEYEPIEIHEAQRPEIEAALRAPGSKSRNERGALSVSKFKSIGQLMWPRD